MDQTIYKPQQANVSLFQPPKPADPTVLFNKVANSAWNQAKQGFQELEKDAMFKAQEEGKAKGSAGVAPNEMPTTQIGRAEYRAQQSTYAGTVENKVNQKLLELQSRYPNDPEAFQKEWDAYSRSFFSGMREKSATAAIGNQVQAAADLKVYQMKIAAGERALKDQRALVSEQTEQQSQAILADARTSPNNIFSSNPANAKAGWEAHSINKARLIGNLSSQVDDQGNPMFTPAQVLAYTNKLDRDFYTQQTLKVVSDPDTDPEVLQKIQDGTFTVKAPQTDGTTKEVTLVSLVGTQAYDNLRGRVTRTLNEQEQKAKQAEIEAEAATNKRQKDTYEGLVMQQLDNPYSITYDGIDELERTGQITTSQAYRIKMNIGKVSPRDSKPEVNAEFYRLINEGNTDEARAYLVTNGEYLSDRDRKINQAALAQAGDVRVFSYMEDAQDEAQEIEQQVIAMRPDGVAADDTKVLADAKVQFQSDLQAGVEPALAKERMLKKINKHKVTVEKELKAEAAKMNAFVVRKPPTKDGEIGMIDLNASYRQVTRARTYLNTIDDATASKATKLINTLYQSETGSPVPIEDNKPDVPKGIQLIKDIWGKIFD